MVKFNIPLEYAHLTAYVDIVGTVDWDEVKLNRFKELLSKWNKTEKEMTEFGYMQDEIWNNCEYQISDYEIEDCGLAMYEDGYMNIV